MVSLQCFTNALSSEVLNADKPSISKMIVNTLKNATPPSRLLRLNPVSSRWEELDDTRSLERVNQMLRKNSGGTNIGAVATENSTLKSVVDASGNLFHLRRQN
jgi:hypothetical protein